MSILKRLYGFCTKNSKEAVSPAAKNAKLARAHPIRVRACERLARPPGAGSPWEKWS